MPPPSPLRAALRRSGVAVAVSGLLAGGLLGTACGGTGSGVGPGTTPVPSRTSTTGAVAWRPTPVSSPVGLAAVACGSPTACVAVDAEGRAHGFDGTRWSAPQPAAAQAIGPGAPSASCASTASCQLVTTGGDAVTPWNGSTLGPPATLPGAHGITAVGCAPTGYCAAVDAEGFAFALEGGTWTATSGDWGSVAAVSCVSATFCVSVSGGISTWDGHSWTTPDPMGAASSFAGVSCATAASCVAVTRGGEALAWNGTGWSAPARIEPAGTGAALGPAPTSVSCPAAGTCLVVDDAGGTVAWTSGRWVRSEVDPGHRLTSVACPTPRWCVAVDDRGAALTGDLLAGGPSAPAPAA